MFKTSILRLPQSKAYYSFLYSVYLTTFWLNRVGHSLTDPVKGKSWNSAPFPSRHIHMAKNNGAMQSTYPAILVALCLKTKDTRAECVIPGQKIQSLTVSLVISLL